MVGLVGLVDTARPLTTLAKKRLGDQRCCAGPLFAASGVEVYSTSSVLGGRAPCIQAPLKARMLEARPLLSKELAEGTFHFGGRQPRPTSVCSPPGLGTGLQFSCRPVLAKAGGRGLGHWSLTLR